MAGGLRSLAGGKLGASLDAFSKQAVGQMPAVLWAAALSLEVAVKQELSKPGSGRLYRRRSRRGRIAVARARRRAPKASEFHRASAPGEPPAPDTGTLRNSIHTARRGTRVTVGTPVDYAPPLEFGGIHLKRRPFMRPAFERWKREVGTQTAALVREALRSRATIPDGASD